ncbi:MAG: glycoside hydrolase family 28 protein [Acidobacteria bacterium]|nr:glycoside hydrolase family 28 protein [Acidobacteriota bacterium]
MKASHSGRREFLLGLAATTAAAPAGASAEYPASVRLPAGTHDSSDPRPARQVANVLDFGAVGDGRTLSTAAIQAAINACAAAGGGKVLVPPGRYLTGPIFLKSNLQFEVMAGATLLGSTNFADYPTISGWWEGLERTIYASMITGIDLENVAITGRGTLDGQGAVWLEAWGKTEDLRRRLGLKGREPENPPGSPLLWPRPRVINLYRSRQVQIRGLTIQNSPSWTVHPVLCEDVYIDGITILNPPHSWNTDGIDPESCRNVRIASCYISTGDDCIMLKSGYKQIPGKPFLPTENVAVTNCAFNAGGCGVGIGSETAGGVRNVAISNCVCDGTTCGLYFRTARGRGNVVENVSAVNVVMRNLEQTGVVVSMFYEDEDRLTVHPVDIRTPIFRSIHCSDILLDGAKTAIVIEGLPESPIQQLSLENIFVRTAEEGISCYQVHGLSLSNAVVNANSGPAVKCKNVLDLDLVRVRAANIDSKMPAMLVEDVHGAMVESCSAQESSPALVEVKGKGNRDIMLAMNRVSNHTQEVAFTDGASEQAVVRRI